MSKNNILISCAGRRVELVKYFKESLLKISPNAKIFASDLNPNLSSACYFADDIIKTMPIADDNYIDNLLTVCVKNNIGLIVPTIDTELLVLSQNTQLFLDNDIEIVISSPDLISRCRDKRVTHDLFNNIGIQSPTIYEKSNIIYPCFCKPYDGSNSSGARIIYSKNHLTPEIDKNEKNIFMELVPENYKEYTVDAYFDRNQVLKCLIPRERIEVRAGEVSKGITRKNYVYNYLKDKLKLLEGARGCVTVQVFGDPISEDIKGLEINPRFGGGFPLGYSAGGTFPEWILNEYFQNIEIEFYEDWKDNLLMLRYDSMVINEN